MSHLHIPDGVLPGWLVMAGWILTALILAFSIYRTRSTELKSSFNRHHFSSNDRVHDNPYRSDCLSY